jgi:putative tryptophan/tyrosine transport system substrate-binding protein
VRRRHLLALASTAGLMAFAASAQSAGGVRRIGVLMPHDPQDPFGKEIIGALRQALSQQGWTEGGNIQIEERWIGNDLERRHAYAAELANLSPEVIFACFEAQLAALRRETKTIPIVFVGVTDPVGSGFVANIARPGGNITGFTFFEPPLVGKWLALLKELAPQLSEVALIFNPDTALVQRIYLPSLNEAAPILGVTIAAAPVQTETDIENAIAALGIGGTKGLIVAPDTFNVVNRGLIVRLAAEYRVPAVYVFRTPVVIGGLVSYGPDQIDVVRRSAGYVDRILRGAHASELPVQGPTKFELVINLKTAKALGLAVPPSLLARADEVIE